jgi:hypothetical protein
MRIKTLRSDLKKIKLNSINISKNNKHTLYAKSFAVKIPLNPSSSSTTRTQSVRLAAHSWLASATVMFSGTVNAGLGLRAATVPLVGTILPPGPPRLDRWWVVDIVRFRASSDSIFFRIAYY